MVPLMTILICFCVPGFGCVNENIDQGRSYSHMSINISHCFFSRYSTYIGNGGVIYINGESFSMNATHSMFFNCVCANHGGAIFFSSKNSLLKMNCVNRCTGSYEHFAHIDASLLNQVEYLSVSKCA